MPKTALELFAEKVDYLLKAEKRLDKAVVAHQRAVFEMLVAEYLPLFQTKDGLILDTPANDALVNRLDNFIAKLDKAFYRDVIGLFATDLLKTAELSAEYYVGLGFKKSVVSKLLKNKVSIEKRLGITPTGRLRKDGYLYKLGQTPEVRNELTKYVINSLTGDVSYLDFQLGFRNLVIGNRRVKGLATTGKYQRYFDQFAYDTFNQVDAMASSQIASNLGLKHFVYEGSVIKTTRAFCRKRAGKAFTVTEADKWKDDPDLIDKKTKDSYRPLIDRGRYRCRHFIRYITEELYRQIKAGAI